MDNFHSVSPSTFLSMTLAMFDRVTVSGIESIRTMNNIITNLTELHTALLRIEKEVNGDDGDDKQG